MSSTALPRILYEDNHLLVVEKPPNIPVQADRSGDMDLLRILKDYIKEKYQKPGEAYLGLCHRLDRPVGGVMVFARTSKAAARLTAQFKGREAEKRYAAVVCGAPPARGEWQEYLLAQEGALRALVFAESVPGAKQARLRYRALAYGADTALLSIRLLTGRKHQIRAQLAAHGYPIQHDQRYHPTPSKGQIALWAYSLCITHPTRGERMEFFSLPQGEAFSEFPAQLAGLPLHRSCDICYMDSHVLAVCKRAGLETARADAGEDSLQAQLEAQLGTALPAHRLDANTEGLLLFGRSLAAQAALEHALRLPGTEKIYHCIVAGTPQPEAGLLEAWAQKDAQAALLRVSDAAQPGAKKICTAYTVLEGKEGLSLLEVRLHTGRTHQIRAHLAYMGWPVLGDDKYGSREQNRQHKARRQQLLSKRLVLEIPPEEALLQHLQRKVFLCLWELELP